MSRTYRRHLVSEYKVSGRIYDEESSFALDELYKPEWGIWYFSGHRQRIRKSRDGKPRYKPCKEFKKINRKLEKAKVKNAIRAGKEVVPVFKKSNVWNWN